MAGVEELAYSEALRLCEGVDDDVKDIRRRAGTLLAALAISTAFLGGQVLELGTGELGEDLVFTISVLIGCTLFLLVGGLIVRIIWPVKGWMVNLYPKIILEDFARPSLEETYEELASIRQNHYANNQQKLSTLYKYFKVAAALFIVEVLVWLWTLASVII